MNLHLVALPHLRATPEASTCAYTQKVVKFIRMFPETTLYAPEGSEAPNLVETITRAERLDLFGLEDPTRMPFWPDDDGWALHNERAIEVLNETVEQGDVVMIAGGYSSRQIADALRGRVVVCEPFVGYPGIYTELCAFESYAWRHHVYGTKQMDGRWFDTVIPNYFDPEEFSGSVGQGDYLLFMGRVTLRKGPHIAAEIAQRAGMPLVVAGPGVISDRNGNLVADHVEVGGVSYRGVVGVNERSRLMREALAIVVPTTYIEPFGGVAVEAMMAGTPAITSDWGAFTETVEQGVTGFRFSMLHEGVDAVERCRDLDPVAVQDRANERYSIDAVRPMFERWFEKLETLYNEGWYARGTVGVRG